MVGSHKSPKTQKILRTDEVSEIKFMCTECGKSLKSQKKFELHCLGHGDPDLECNKCHKVFASKFSLKNHRKIHQRKHQCTCCTKTYTNLEELKTHMAITHFVFMCDLCDYTASNFSKLELHMLCHKERHIKETSDRDFTLSVEDDLMSESVSQTPPPDDCIFNSGNEELSKMDEIQRADSVIAKVMSNKIFLLHSKKARRHKIYKKVIKTLSLYYNK